MSYANVIMYNAVIPGYHSDDGVEKEVVDADRDPSAVEGVLQ
jgi:hypothetical protein